MKPRRVVWDGLDAYEIMTDAWCMIVIAGCGPRIAFLGKIGGENILYWQNDKVSRGAWRLRGGHRVWLTRPMADESEDTYLADNDPCAVTLTQSGLVLTAPAHPVNHLSRGMDIECLSAGTFRVTNFVRNDGDLIYSGGVWSPTCIDPAGKQFRIPLGRENVTWDIVRIVVPRIFAGNATSLDDPQVSFENNDMLISPMGTVCKRCVAAPKGRIEMTWPEKGIKFTKQSAYDQYARYPLDGCNVAVFVGKDNWMVEMETFGREQAIIPGQTAENTEFWTLT